jgi:hypothetical protein
MGDASVRRPSRNEMLVKVLVEPHDIIIFIYRCDASWKRLRRCYVDYYCEECARK